LGFLAKSLQHYSRNTAARIARTMITTANDIQSWSDPIEQKQVEVDRLVTLAEAERNKGMAGSMTDIQARQAQHGQKLEKSQQALQKLSAEVLGPISRIDQHLSLIQDELARNIRTTILDSISSLKFVVQHKLAHSGLVEDSGKWFLNKPQYQQWRDESCSSILWLHGIPGSGKTKLTSMVVSESKKSNHTAFFYSVRNPVEPERSESDHILRSLLRQLSCPSPGGPILGPILSKYEDALEGSEDYSDVLWTFDDCIEAMIELCNLYPAVVLIIDALDEVNPLNRLDLLNGLLRVMEESDALIKIFISSRENMDIFDCLETKPNLFKDN
jgi:hypothetical protein